MIILSTGDNRAATNDLFFAAVTVVWGHTVNERAEEVGPISNVFIAPTKSPPSRASSS